LSKVYGSEELVVLEYHYTDEFATSETEDRIRWYNPSPAFPTCYFDGVDAVIGGWSGTYQEYLTVINNHLNDPSPLSLDLFGSVDEGSGTVEAHIGVIDALPGGTNVVMFVVYEDSVESGVEEYRFVVRDILPQETLTISQPGETASIVRDFTIDPAWDAEHIGVIAFVQNTGTKEVFQAAGLTESVTSIEGYVTDIAYGNPLDALVSIVGGTRSTTTDSTGYYKLPCKDDTTFTVQASSYGYRTQQQASYVPPDSSSRLDFALEEALPGYLEGWVRSALDGQPIEGAEVLVLHTPLTPQTTNADGYYSFVIPGGATYQVEAVMPTYTGETKSAMVDEGGTTVLSFALGQAESFEDDNGGYTGLMLWEWGTPSSYGPGGAHWGTKCWATNLDGPYGNNANSPLYSGVYSLDEATSATFNFYHYFSSQLNRDGGNVKISTNGGTTWTLITPVAGYPTPAMGWNGEPGFTGASDGWELVTFDLSAYLGQDVKFKFTFGSDGSVTAPGWYIDDVYLELTYPVSLTLEPDTQTVPKGTNLGFDASAGNAADYAVSLQVWSEVLLPGGTPYWNNPIFGPVPVTLQAHATPSVHLTQFIPRFAPLGEYTYIMKIGQYPDVVYARDFFDFTVVNP
jgi:hypothetical protein